MPTTEIITIINNSGKVISTGKQLVSIFKEAQAAYRDRRDAIKAERAGIQRAKTFDVSQRGDPYYDDYRYGRYSDEIDHAYDRRRSYDGDDRRSHASSRFSRHSRRSQRPRSAERALPALTEGNLKTHSEVSATTPSKAAYRPPNVETAAPRDVPLSRPPLAIGAPPAPSEPAAPAAPAPPPPDHRGQLVHRARSDFAVVKKKSIDMDLAYGDIPPDLAERVDLDPTEPHAGSHGGGGSEPETPEEAAALSLMDRIEAFLEEAQCMHQSATTMIENLQRNPEAAAAVALSLAELSALLGRMGAPFLAFLKGGSPAVFALLASPQFLIGASVAVGVTVVMFGGLKIVKRIREAAERQMEAPFEMRAAAAPAMVEKPLPAIPAQSSYDEALVLREVEELSTIETWRRGIVPFGGEDESAADVELLSREAERALRESFQRDLDEVEPCDSVSQVSRARSDRSRRSYRSYRSRRSRHEHRPIDEHSAVDIPERKSSKKDKDGGESEAASERSHRSHLRSSRSHREGKHEGSGSTVSSRKHETGSTVSRSSKHSSKISLTAIEEKDSGDDAGSAAGSAAGKPKKREMIKQLFKMKKDKEDRERAVSVLV
ncbi:hypothetical protein C8A03DRAFT_38585 [Achaetomium macrosporum]|uniref:Uncharacterized protein n=1 Tax=Achaetomium macrosporum TaxID=79813 RepID=A0AAN7C1N0_9PEZI|nr:hypothetical protein C8A03DRAFT_38585 [Achaetomium macrosporum]